PRSLGGKGFTRALHSRSRILHRRELSRWPSFLANVSATRRLPKNPRYFYQCAARNKRIGRHGLSPAGKSESRRERAQSHRLLAASTNPIKSHWQYCKGSG